ncbi:WW domain-containing protein [Colletotrichum tofieldiae]|uniref:WW domain-containing protein n=1 Tax=Colletotrichum tofieldiae TaxID=708197 RepID=A0A166N024_9PEZI|nr:WW domain-containing protein [Colletotrichum tofieldiae]GKT53075.1 WW domain-containing protein [Colletotrichum tofieldiae]GKT81090.1 WW domain-containing protein [Colletotrichum tofieldiae]GKT88648.1 WW domain-containing protein [Colletotrichum tofieldiae]
MASDSPRPASSPREAEPEQSRPADGHAEGDQPIEQDSATPPEADDNNSNRDSSSPESGEASSAASPAPADASDEKPVSSDAPPLPNEAPPLPSEPAPATEDDGWDFQWDPTSQAYFFYNRFTGATQWENPRVSVAAASTSAAPGTTPAVAATATSGPPPLPTNDRPPAGGYNPAIHGDYDPDAWYAKGNTAEENEANQASSAAYAAEYGAVAQFNRFTGQFQTLGDGPDRHSDEAKSKRQMNAFFDVDAAANSHDGRSLKAERSGKKPSKAELKQFKEKRRARKEEKRRAWLRD